MSESKYDPTQPTGDVTEKDKREDQATAEEDIKVMRTEMEAVNGLHLNYYLYLFIFYFNLYIYPPDSQESDGGANT